MGVKATLFGLALLIILPLLAWLVFFPPKPNPCAKDPASCVANWDALQPYPELKVAGQPLTQTIRIPCAFVGTWVSKGEFGTYKLDLYENGTYTNYMSRPAHGLWGVQGNSMIWRHLDGNWHGGRPALYEHTAILLPTKDRFVLEEMNRSFTAFDLIGPRPRTRCTNE
jgi:hypothetical protein